MLFYWIIIIILGVGIYGYSLYMRKKFLNKGATQELPKPKLKKFDDPNTAKLLKLQEGNLEPSSEYPNLAFGVWFINGGAFSTPPKTLVLDGKPEALKKYDLKSYWDIVDSSSAVNQMERLKQLPSVKAMEGTPIFPSDLASIIIDYSNMPLEEQKENFNDMMGAYNELDTKITTELLPSLYNELGMSYDKIMKVNTIAIWDLERMAGLARKCYYADFITKEECYNYLSYARENVKKHVSNWEEYVVSYLLGRVFMYEPTKLWQWTDSAGSLLTHETSIWNETKSQIWGS